MNLYDKGIHLIRNMSDEELKRLLYKTCPVTLGIPCERCRNKYTCVDCWNQEEYKQPGTKAYLLQELKQIPFYTQRIAMLDERLAELEEAFTLRSYDYSQPRIEYHEDFTARLARQLDNKAKLKHYRADYIRKLNHIYDSINALNAECKRSIERYIYIGMKNKHFDMAIEIMAKGYNERK